MNWDSFKWRNHQPDIGRFFNVDPLSQKYYYNSPYAFSENKVIAHRELEGLEAQSIKPIKSQDSEKSNLNQIGRGLKQFGSDFLKNFGLKAAYAGVTKLMHVIPQEKDAPKNIDGYSVSVEDKSSVPTPNEKFLPKPGKGDMNNVDKAYIDAMSAVQGRRTNVGSGRPEVGETISETTGASADAAQAGQQQFRERPIFGDTVFFKRGGAIPNDPRIIRSEMISDTSAVVIRIP